TPNDYVASALPETLARFRERWPEVRFSVRTDYYGSLLRQLHCAEIDLMIGLSTTPLPDARHSLAREVVWVHSESTQFDSDRPIPLVSYGAPCVYHKLAIQVLKSAGFDWTDVFTGPSFTSLKAAVAAGLGVMAITRRRADEDGNLIWEDAPLPKLPDLYSGILIREGGARPIYERLADEIAAVVHAPAVAKAKLVASSNTPRKAISAA
ncbi:MAG: hypothetical protein K9G60_03925, partial [Pseudolabrys sp.]|nr:hypothetical protein [Pseudolabrys sp.]